MSPETDVSSSVPDRVNKLLIISLSLELLCRTSKKMSGLLFASTVQMYLIGKFCSRSLKTVRASVSLQLQRQHWNRHL